MFEAMKGSRKLLVDRVVEQITQLVIEQDLEAGDKLPNEYELAERLNVGRGTVREAVKQLVARNILEIRRGKGTFVTNRPGVLDDPLGFAFFRDKYKLLTDTIEVRLILEPAIAALAAANADEREIRRMKELCLTIDRLAQNDEDFVAFDIELHTCIAKSTGNLVMPNLIPIITTGISLYNKFPKYERQAALAVHHEIIDAIAARDPEAAREAAYRHLLYNKRNLAGLAEYLAGDGRAGKSRTERE
jgi:GntR family transcriptional repressor for pyruvate dehydrogenase complex